MPAEVEIRVANRALPLVTAAARRAGLDLDVRRITRHYTWFVVRLGGRRGDDGGAPWGGSGRVVRSASVPGRGGGQGPRPRLRPGADHGEGGPRDMMMTSRSYP